MSFEDFYTIWDPYWSKRGKGSKDYCLTRISVQKPWDKDNTIAMTRLEQLRSTYRGKGSAHKVNRS